MLKVVLRALRVLRRYMKGHYTAQVRSRIYLRPKTVRRRSSGPGEELHLTFAGSIATPKTGWTRRFVLEARGWCKDMDLDTRDGDTVEPLPGTRAAAAAGLQRRNTTHSESGR